MGNLSYEEYIPFIQELQKLISQNGALYETFRELLCHFKIYLDIHGVRGNFKRLKNWANYFPHLDNSLEEIQATNSNAEIEARMVASECGDVIFEEDDGEYEKGESCKSYHHQAR